MDKEIKRILNDVKKNEYLSKINLNRLNTNLKASKSKYRVGRVLINREGPAYIRIYGEADDVKVEYKRLGEAIFNDLVLIKLLKKSNEGQVIKVIKREINQYVGEDYLKGSSAYVKLDNFRYRFDILIPKKNINGAVVGNKVAVKIVAKEDQVFIGEVIKVLGHVNDVLDIEVLSSIYAHGFETDFNPEVLNEALKMPPTVTKDDLKGRVDFRSQSTFTIDGSDAKDHDDAVAISWKANSNPTLYVHIADVTHYVREGSLLYNEAYQRGTSLYVIDKAVPMLPPSLSNGICSLNEDVDRLTVTCEMEIDKQGKVVNYDIYESVIKSKKRMTYEAVNKLLEEKEIVPGYEPFVFDLKKMNQLASILRKARTKRGSLDFDNQEIKVIVDSKGMPVKIVKRESGLGEQVIEDFMIIANETVASHIFKRALPFIYRVHAKPQKEKIDEFLFLLAKLKISPSASYHTYKPKMLQELLTLLKTEPCFPVLSNQLLRKLSRAEYQMENIGHFGLASNCYTHFTSPIRRFPDLKVHQLLKKYKDLKKGLVKREANLLPTLCSHASLKEYYAVMCERDVNDYMASLYMKNYIGDKFKGYIADIGRYGAYVLLDNLIEGRVSNCDFPNHSYRYNESKLQYEGHGATYKIGDQVTVQLIATDEKERQIDFKIIND